MRILEEIYYGKLEWQELTRYNKELFETSKLCYRNKEKLLSTMTDEQKLLFEKFIDCNDELHCISERESFIQGFKFATKLIIESMN